LPMYSTIQKLSAKVTISKQLQWLRSFIASIFILSCIAFSQLAQAVSPAPDGGYATGNTAEGTNALFSLVTNLGFNETAIGFEALRSNSTGTLNTAAGVVALQSNTNGSNNTATGEAALFHNTIGNRNTANGNFALAANTNGSDNTATGYAALSSSGFDATGNTATGSNALFNNVSAGFK